MDDYKEAWYAIWDRIKKYSPDFAAGPLSGKECVLKWIDEHATKVTEIGKDLEIDSLKRDLSRYQNEVLDGLENDVKRLKRTIELRDVRMETLGEDLRVAREDRDRYREQIGNLLSAIHQWKVNSGLY